MSTELATLKSWVDATVQLTQPDEVIWCDGSQTEYDALVGKMTDDGTLLTLNQDKYPGCYLHRSNPNDVARVEHLTFVCSDDETDAGPNNHWMAPDAARKKMHGLFDGCMRGRTMYVIPYCMGPIDSPYSRCGVEITDSAYVVVNMKLMTRMGAAALERIERDGQFVKGLHSTGTLDPDARFIMHFPESLEIMSYGSGYGGNALLGKKCHALRIASWQAREEGWLAEHMLIVGIQNPQGQTHYVACAFPSACGKTNLAMLIPPASQPGWKIWTLGDDIAWLHLDDHGQLRAVNPEAGYFGVVPGTNEKTNKNAFDTIQRDTIFTNVALTEDNCPWWEDKDDERPALNWRGEPWDGESPAAHPNARFTVSASNNPSYSDLAEAPEGVPISAIVFGGRRKSLAPLIYEANDWHHGVMVAAGVASETTAAATGEVGVVRRDPMAMKPFCGYNFADYWSHWLSFTKRTSTLPKIFHVNWFRQDADGRFMWPGFGENLRVLRWILDRCDNHVSARQTPVGMLPLASDIDRTELAVDDQTLDALLHIDNDAWQDEMSAVGDYLDTFGDRLPVELTRMRERVSKALTSA